MARKSEAKRELTVVQFCDTFPVICKKGSQGMEAFPVQVIFAHFSVQPYGYQSTRTGG